MIERKNEIHHGAWNGGWQPCPKDILDTKKKEGRAASQRLASTHSGCNFYLSRRKRNKQGNCLMGKLKELGMVGDVVNYLIAPI